MYKIIEIYTELSQSERFGLQFGMFPADKCKGLTRDESITLMQYGKQNQYK